MNWRNMVRSIVSLSAVAVMFLTAGCGCGNCRSADVAARIPALDDSAWESSVWISVKDAPVARKDVEIKQERAADGTSRFIREVVNRKAVKSAKWMTAGLGVYDIYVNGRIVGDDFLKPGFTHVRRTRRSFTYDVTAMMDVSAGAKNVFAADVSAGWWRDKIVNFAGKKSAFRAVLELVYSDGAREIVGTDEKTWKGAVGGPVKHAAIFDGEEYDARVPEVELKSGEAVSGCEVNTEFGAKEGVILPSQGAEIYLRRDLTLKPVEAYVWKGVVEEDAQAKIFGKVKKLRGVDFSSGAVSLEPGETLVVDFGQNCAGVPEFSFSAEEGTTLVCLPAEMLNDSNGERKRGNDGPGGSVYRENLRCPDRGMRLVYTFGANAPGRFVKYSPRLTFFGYRYVSVTVDKPVAIAGIVSVPVTSISKAMEIGRIKTGDASINRLIANVYWGQLSNYLSVPTDCPQRNERLGWTADTQVFAEAGAFNADTRKFFHKWMRDMVDSRDADGGFPSVAPYAQYGNETFSLGWADAGVIVPYRMWTMFADRQIIEENYDAMAKYVRKLDETKFDYEGKLGFIYADWLSYQKFETAGNSFGGWGKWGKDPDAMNYRRFLAACYWLDDARMLSEMAAAIGRADDAKWFAESSRRAREYIRGRFLEADGLPLKPMRELQTANLFALHFNVVDADKRDAVKQCLLDSIKAHGDCLQTGFLGTSVLMDTLTEAGSADVAYTLLFQRKNPSWLYSVDQGATTIWERWNSYRKDTGFGPVGMNSFNHYAYGAVLAWIYKTAAGIAADPADPGFKTVIMAPVPDKRLGFVEAEYKSAAGLIKSAWRYEGEKWIWNFTVPDGSRAMVKAPGDNGFTEYKAGVYEIVR